MRRALVLSLAPLLGCGSSVVDATGGSTSGAPTTGSAPDPSTSAVPGSSSGTTPQGTTSSGVDGSAGSTTSSIAWETEGADEGYATTGGCGFTCPQPGGGGGVPQFECSLAPDDCPEGERCAPWANDGGFAWNALRCVPVDNSPGSLGDTCDVEGSYISGIDSCDVGLWCGPDDAQDEAELTGSCRLLCTTGACSAGTTCVVPGVAGIGVCQDTCDPIDAACPGTQACMPAGYGFACHPAHAESIADACVWNSQCATGSLCIDAPQCGADGERCCVPYCDLDAPDCAEGQTCLDYGSPLPDYENVGYCAG